MTEIYTKALDGKMMPINDPLEHLGGWENVEDQGYSLLCVFKPSIGSLGRVKIANDESMKKYAIEIYSDDELLLLEFFDFYMDALLAYNDYKDQ